MPLGPLANRRAVAGKAGAAATRHREASGREQAHKLRSTLMNAAIGAPTRSTLRESESGALAEDLFELAIVNVFFHTSSEFHRRRPCRAELRDSLKFRFRQSCAVTICDRFKFLNRARLR
jgi:hypothetical protein